MPRKKKKPLAQKPPLMRWGFDANIPTNDFFEERLPERDRPIFIKLMQEKLGLSSAQEPIAEHL
jgi:hypothetical protein